MVITLQPALDAALLQLSEAGYMAGAAGYGFILITVHMTYSAAWHFAYSLLPC
jgi:hypothetical protein